MKISDLIAIGKLGNTITNEGYISFRKKKEYSSFLLNTKDVFLLFTDHRVRYVTIEDENESSIRLVEQDITKEAAKDGNVQLLLGPDDFDCWKEEVQLEPYYRYAALENDVIIGKICDYVVRSLQNMFEIELESGNTFFVPHVSQFVSSIDNHGKKIFFHDLTELKSL
jgi:ribosomal 30S subunit maturation factor RimM